jgi:peroxiredoxin
MAPSSVRRAYPNIDARTPARKRASSVALASFLALGVANDAPGKVGTPVESKPETGAESTALPKQANNAWQVPAFRLPDLQGDSHTLADWKGKVILLNFWASWCSPCYYETRDMIRYQTEYGRRGLQVIGVGLDKARKIRNFARTLGVTYPLLVAEPEKHPGIMEPWGNHRHTLPYTVVIDRNGDIAHVQPGLFSQEAFETFVLPLLGNEER